jgi:hypothetical protein
VGCGEARRGIDVVYNGVSDSAAMAEVQSFSSALLFNFIN